MKLEIDFKTGSEEIAARAERNACQAFMAAAGSYNAGNSRVVDAGPPAGTGFIGIDRNPLLQEYHRRIHAAT